jgi:hypothetical protein
MGLLLKVLKYYLIGFVFFTLFFVLSSLAPAFYKLKTASMISMAKSSY